MFYRPLTIHLHQIPPLLRRNCKGTRPRDLRIIVLKYGLGASSAVATTPLTSPSTATMAVDCGVRMSLWMCEADLSFSHSRITFVPLGPLTDPEKGVRI